MGAVEQAQKETDEIKKIAMEATKKQMKNLEEGQQLLEKTDHMNKLAHSFQKDAHRME